MKNLFKVGDDVMAIVNGFDPFPAVVENVLLNETDFSVFYYVRFCGASEIVPLDAENLLSPEANKHRVKLKYSEKELRKESKLRVDALLGPEDDIPEVLMNFVTVDSDFEEVSEEAVKKLGLCSIVLTPMMVDKLGRANADSEDETFVDIEGDHTQDEALRLGIWRSKTGSVCPSCLRKFKSKIALNAHLRQMPACNSSSPAQAVLQSQTKSTTKSSRTRVDKSQSHKSDLSKKVDEIKTINKSKWASRSASGYYPCKLCFRKFRSKGEAQFHMSSHKSHLSSQRVNKIISPEESISQDSSDSFSVEDEGVEGRSQEYHSSMERVRRAEIATKFSELAEAAGLDKKTPKILILLDSKVKIEELERESEQQYQEITNLRNKMVMLKARCLELDPEENVK